MDALSVLAPVGDPQYATLRPTLALDAGAARAVLRGPPTCSGTRPPRGAAPRCTARARSRVIPGDRLRPPRPVALHLPPLLGGRRARRVSGSFGWMGRFLDLHGVADNPLQGLSLDCDLSPGLAAAQRPGRRRRRGPTTSGSDVPGVGNPVLGPMYSADRRPRRAADAPIRRWPGARWWRPRWTPSARRSLPYQGNADPARAGHLPRTSELRAQAGRSWPRCSPPACRSARSPSTRRAPGTRTPTRPARSAATSRTTFDALLAFQRDLEARGIADRVLIQVWTEFGRRPQENARRHRPRRGRRLVPHRHQGAPARWSASSRAWRTLDAAEQPHASTTDFRGVYCSLLEQWFGVDAGADHPGRGELHAAGADRRVVGGGGRTPLAGGAVAVGVEAVVVVADRGTGRAWARPLPPAQS